MPGPPCTPIKGRMQANHTLLNRLSKTIVLRNASAGSAKAATGGRWAVLLKARIRKSVHIKFLQ